MFNPMERIRKLAGMPDMSKGYPPPDRRRCSDWAAFVDAVDTVTRELVDQILQCQASSLKIATSKAELAGQLAAVREKEHGLDVKRLRSGVDFKMLEHGIEPGVREEVSEVFDG